MASSPAPGPPLMPTDTTPLRARRRKDDEDPDGAQRRISRKKLRPEATPAAAGEPGTTLLSDSDALRNARRSSLAGAVVDGVLNDDLAEPCNGDEVGDAGPTARTAVKAKSLAKLLGETHHKKLRMMITNSLRTNVHVKKQVWFQECQQFFSELPPNVQRNFASADDLARMVYNDATASIARWRRVMLMRLNSTENKAEFVARMANLEQRQRVTLALAAIVLPPPYYLPTPQEIQRADLNLEQWMQAA